ncbi:MAG: tail fiber domain-containing protein [Flavobacteriales bacterium]|nr:tail fiber domain-containing protein [Flavobacteriales bacterium]
MNTRRTLSLGMGLLITVSSWAQVDWNMGGNNVSLGTDYLGCDGTSTFPLHLRTIPDLSIDFSTSNLLRMRLYPNQVPTINGFAVPTSGFLGLSGNANFFNGVGPFSRLHLADNAFNLIVNAQQSGYRSWQRNGITFTGNGDHSYIGQKFNGLDNTDLLLLWSNDPGPDQFAPDRLTIRFASGFTGAPSGANSDECLEAARFYPVDVTQVNFGLGDFFAGNLADPVNIIDPTERLDVLNGRVRIRALPEPAGEVTASYKVMVVDDSPAPSAERGVVKWIDPNDLPPTGGSGGADCDWDISSSGNKITTAWKTVNTNGNCPEADWNVGVGTSNPVAKLHVERTSALLSGEQRAGLFSMNANTNGDDKVGLDAVANGSGGTNHGVRAEAKGSGTPSSPDGNTRVGVTAFTTGGALITHGVNATAGYGRQMTCGLQARGDHGPSGVVKPDSIFGVRATAGNGVLKTYGVYTQSGAAPGNGSIMGRSYGVYAETGASLGNATPPAAISYGIYAKRRVPSAAHPNNWAGWFEGKVNITSDLYVNGMYYPSDADLKTNILPLEGALEKVLALEPKTYTFIEQANPLLTLPVDEQMGLMAQAVEEVLPGLVGSRTIPAEYDSLGNLMAEAVTHRTLNYVGFVPVLIGAIKEQQTVIHEQQASSAAQTEALNTLLQRVDALERLLAECCRAGSSVDQRASAIDNEPLRDPASERLLTIAPNPFTDRTTVSYTLERGGRAQLLVNSSDGKHLLVLEEGQRSEGQYNYTWSTAHLAPGVYYVTLLLDGEPLVKRAVKVQ